MTIHSFTVKPRIPEALQPLEEIAHNLWLSWNFDAIMLFIRLDYEVWMQSHQNPARMLGMVSQERYEQMSQDDSYLAALKLSYDRFVAYRDGDPWYSGDRHGYIGYFSIEYGLDVSLPIYSGGLGILSGDHLKSSSDLGLPLVGVGLLYRQGYFRQYLSPDGFQQELYPENDWYNMPVRLCSDAAGKALLVSVEMGRENALAQIWEVLVGRSRLYLLDTNIEANNPEIRGICSTLYGGEEEGRLRQELLLGVGGVRALQALGIDLVVSHLNEAHAAFLILERTRQLMVAVNCDFLAALQAIWPTCVFTTHCSAPGTGEGFPLSLMESYLRPWLAASGIDWGEFLELGRRPGQEAEVFDMTAFALRSSAYCNALSRGHAEVARGLWRGIWPGLPEREIPISHINSGVHPRTWISNTLLDLLDRYFGPRFTEEPTNRELWDRMGRISDEELWRAHERRRERLVVFARDRLRQQMRRNGVTEVQLQRAEDVLSPYTLTIVFARRFTEQERGGLLLADPERLARLLCDPDRPIQLVFAGKAHPKDLAGKELIKTIVHFAQGPELRSRVVFLEDYDMTMARYLTAGADVWLSTPRKPREADGLSGIKAALNGVVNCSILGGWWEEIYSPECEAGWAIGKGETYNDPGLQDSIESKAIYDLLERDIIPSFYSRGRDGLPREWIKRMKASIRLAGRDYSSHRMLVEYSERCYFPAMANARRLAKGDYSDAKDLSAYLKRLRAEWCNLGARELESDAKPIMERGQNVWVSALVRLGGLLPEEVQVELVFGELRANGDFGESRRLEMQAQEKRGEEWLYRVKLSCGHTGRQGFALRILPRHQALIHPFLPGFIHWA